MSRKQSRADAFFDYLADEDGLDEGADDTLGPGDGLKPPPRQRRDDSGGSGGPRRSGLKLIDDGDTGGTEGLDGLDSVDGLGPPAPVGQRRAAAGGPAVLEAGADEDGADALVDRLSLLDAPEEPAAERDDDSVSTEIKPIPGAFDLGADAPKPRRLKQPEALDNSAMSRPVAAEEVAPRDKPQIRERSSPEPDKGPSWEQQKRYERLKALVQESPESADPLIRLGNVCHEMGRVQEALLCYRKALRLEPENGFVRQKLKELGDRGARGTTEGPSLGQVLVSALRYPLAGRTGRAVVAGGALLCGVAAAAIQFQPWLGWPMVLLMATLFFAFQGQVVKTAAKGAERPPEWPESHEVGPGIRRGLGALGACFLLPALLGALAVELSPGGWARALQGPVAGESSDYDRYLGKLQEHFVRTDQMAPAKAREAARLELVAMGVVDSGASQLDEAGVVPMALYGLAVLALLFGVYYYPMALLIAVEVETARPAFNYGFGVRETLKAPIDYAWVAGATAGAGLLSAGAAWGLGGLLELPILGRLLGGLAASFVGLYALVALSWFIGCYYRRAEDVLGWFKRGSSIA